MLSPTCSSPLSNRTLFLWREAAHTMIRLSPRSLNPHCCAICKIPSGSGFGRRFGVSLVMIGSKTYDGRWFFKRCVTGALNQQRHQPGLLKRGTRRKLTQSSSYTMRAAPPSSQDNLSAPRVPAAAAARALPPARWPGSFPWRRFAPRAWEGCGCVRGCRLICQCRGRLCLYSTVNPGQ